MKKIAFIPARGGSVSIPKKNIKLFCNKPLLYWNVSELAKSSSIDEVWVATDSEEIAQIVEKFKIPSVNIYMRDPKNAQNHSSTESVLLEFINSKNLGDDTILILSQATSPFTLKEDYECGLKMMDDNSYDSVLSVVENKSFFWNENGEAINYDIYNRPRRQDFTGIMQENGAFYISSIAAIKKSNNRLSGLIGFHIMPEYTALELDEPNDWIIAEKVMEEYILSKTEIKNKIKLFVSDVDGVLTDSGMYYSEKGDELKKFNTKDGMGFEILRKNGIKCGIITSEDTDIVNRRAKKLKIDYLFQGANVKKKLEVISQICESENIDLKNVAYIGDDINCYEALSSVGLSACPSDAVAKIKGINGILIMSKRGGEGVVREFIDDYILN